MRRLILIAIPYLFLITFFLVPFLIVFKISLSDAVIAQPPYLPTLNISEGWDGFTDFIADLDFESYIWLSEDRLYINSFLSSLKIATLSTLFALLVGYPLAYGMAKAPRGIRYYLVMAVILPFWTSFLIRVYAWMGILRTEGFLNQFLIWIGVIDEPLLIMNTTLAVYIGIVYSYLPFIVLPIYSTLERQDASLIEAAIDLGCSRFKAFWLVTAPLSLPGVIAGCALVFIPAVGEFVIPDLLGGTGTLMIGKTLWVEFFSNRDWPVASAVAILLLIFLVAPIVLFQRLVERQGEAQR